MRREEQWEEAAEILAADDDAAAAAARDFEVPGSITMDRCLFEDHDTVRDNTKCKASKISKPKDPTKEPVEAIEQLVCSNLLQCAFVQSEINIRNS
jgi:hypothetical protein